MCLRMAVIVLLLIASSLEAASNVRPKLVYRAPLVAEIAEKGQVQGGGVTYLSPARPRYTFEPVTSVQEGHDEGYYPAINLSEVIYVTNPEYPGTPRPDAADVFSTLRGFLTDEHSWNLGYTDINNHGEVVYANQGIFSTAQGMIADRGILPSISDNGEIVYLESQVPVPAIFSTTRGVLVPSGGFDPSVNVRGEVVYIAGTGFDTIVVSTVKGQVTRLGHFALWPSINNHGEIVYTAKDGEQRQLFSTLRRQVTFKDSFPEPHWANANCNSPIGLYQNGVAGDTDVNDRGEIVFSRWLFEGPFPDPSDPEQCFFWGGLQIVRATPTRSRMRGRLP